MNRAVPLSQFMPYGAPDLIAAGPSYMSRAVVTSSALAVAAFLLVVVVAPLVPKAIEKVVPTPKPYDFLDLRPRPLYVPPAESRPVTPGKIDKGTIEPVPDRAEPDAPVQPQGVQGNGKEDVGDSPPTTQPSQPYHDEEPLPCRDCWVYSDELPVAVREVKPLYPEFAKDAGVEGVVLVHVMVGKDGRVVRAEVNEKHSIPLLNEAALEAARQWVFQPALANNHPVVVWLALPFRFQLHPPR